MKKIYTTLFLSMVMMLSFAQNARVATKSSIQGLKCKACMPSVMTIDTACNFNSTDTLTIYYADMAPHDSGWAIGNNAYGDQGWAERYVVSGSASVIGGAYLLYQLHGASTSTMTANGKVYSISATDGKPATALGTKAIPYATMTLNSFGTPTFFTFTAPVAVTDSFFMALELTPYTLGGSDTLAVVISKDGSRTTTNANQNCAMWNDGSWNYELTQNWGLRTNYGLCTIINVAGGVENYVSKGGLRLYAAYPNPSSDEITLNYSIANSSKVSIEIFDAQGKSVMKIAKGNLPAGMQMEKINVSSFNQGNYFYNVVTETGTIYSQFVVAK
jgi:hypothetical protein